MQIAKMEAEAAAERESGREEAETEAEAEMCFSTLPASLWALRSLGLIPVHSSISASLAIFDHLRGQ